MEALGDVFFKDSGRNTADYGMGRNILRNNGTRGNGCPASNGCASRYDAESTRPRAVLNFDWVRNALAKTIGTVDPCVVCRR